MGLSMATAKKITLIGLFIFSLLAISLITLGLLYSKADENISDLTDTLAVQEYQGISGAIDTDITTIETIASLVQQFPIDSTLPFNFLKIQNTFSGLLSIGKMIRNSNTSNGKFIWELAFGFGCPLYIYGVCNSTSYPAYYGYCMDAYGNLNNTPSYVGQDWGLKPEEASLFTRGLSSQIAQTFIPVFDLLGDFTLTFETINYETYNANNVEVSSFAERNIYQINTYLDNITLGSSGRSPVQAYIYDDSTGYLVSTSTTDPLIINGNFSTPAQSSYPLAVSYGAINSTVKQNVPTSAVSLLHPSDVTVAYGSYTLSGLSWIIVIVLPTDPWSKTLYNRVGGTLVFIFLFTASFSILFTLILYFWVLRDSEDKGTRLRGSSS